MMDYPANQQNQWQHEPNSDTYSLHDHQGEEIAFIKPDDRELSTSEGQNARLITTDYRTREHYDRGAHALADAKELGNQHALQYLEQVQDKDFTKHAVREAEAAIEQSASNRQAELRRSLFKSIKNNKGRRDKDRER